MKKILIIAKNMSLSGVPIVYMSFVRKFGKQYTFDILLLENSDMHFKNEFLSYGGTIYLSNIYRPSNSVKRFFWLLLKYKKIVTNFLNNNIKLDDYCAIHSFEEDYSFPYFYNAKKAGIYNLVVHICSAGQAYPKPKTFSHLVAGYFRKKAFKICSSISCSSTWTLKYNNYKNKGVVLYLDLQSNLSNYGIIEFEHSSQNICLTQIGSFSERKNQLFSIRLISLLKKTYPNIKLQFVGEAIDDNYKQKMISLINNLDIGKNIEFLGTNPDRNTLFQNTSIVLYPSLKESFGLVMVEAQMVGIHCIASSTLPDDADLGNIKFLPLSVEAWADSIIKYFNEFKNIRKKPINIDKFSSKSFENTFYKLTFSKN